MNKYITSDKVWRFVKALRDEGMPYVEVEDDNKVVILMADGTYEKVGIVECHSCEGLVAEILNREEQLKLQL